MCEYGGFQTAARERNGGRLGLRRVWANGRIGGTRMSSIEKVGCASPFRAASWVAMSSAQSAPYKMSRTAASLSRRVARPRRARNRLSRVWVRSSWIGRAQTVRMLYIASHDAARKAQCRNLFLGGSFDACSSFSSLQSVLHRTDRRPSLIASILRFSCTTACRFARCWW